MLDDARSNLKPAASTALVGGVIGTVVMAVGAAAGMTVGGVIGFAVSGAASLVAVGIYLFTLDMTLQQLGVDTRRHRRQARRVYSQMKRLVSIGVRKIRRGLGVALRGVRRSARMVYTRLRGGIR
jgi:hypothetical protein